MTIEAEPEARRCRARKYLRGRAWAVLLTCASASPWTSCRNRLRGRGAFDLTFIDADKKSIPEYFKFALKLSRRGSVIIVDNVVRDGRVIDTESHDPDILGIRRFNEMLAAEPRVSATAIQTVGAKGYDGFAIVLVTDDI